MRLGFYLLYYGVGKSLFWIVFVSSSARAPSDVNGFRVTAACSWFATTSALPIPHCSVRRCPARRVHDHGGDVPQAWMARLLRTIGCFPVDRSRVDHGAVREALRRLRAGRCLGIFRKAGSGWRKNPSRGDPVFKPGAGSIALLGHAAVLPVIVRDTRKPYVGRNGSDPSGQVPARNHEHHVWTPSVCGTR